MKGEHNCLKITNATDEIHTESKLWLLCTARIVKHCWNLQNSITLQGTLLISMLHFVLWLSHVKGPYGWLARQGQGLQKYCGVASFWTNSPLCSNLFVWPQNAFIKCGLSLFLPNKQWTLTSILQFTLSMLFCKHSKEWWFVSSIPYLQNIET